MGTQLLIEERSKAFLIVQRRVVEVAILDPSKLFWSGAWCTTRSQRSLVSHHSFEDDVLRSQSTAMFPLVSVNRELRIVPIAGSELLSNRSWDDGSGTDEQVAVNLVANL
jgi:hypothetical protein